MVIKEMLFIFCLLGLFGNALTQNQINNIICTDVSSSAATGVVTTPVYPGVYPNNLNCTFEIRLLPGYTVNLTLDVLHVEDSNSDYIRFSSSDNDTFQDFTERLGDIRNNISYSFDKKNALVLFHSDSNNNALEPPPPYGFHVSWTAVPQFPIHAPANRSQAIFPDFYNNDLKSFIRDVTSYYSFLDDKSDENLYHSRFGVIEFDDTPVVSVPLGDYSRYDFLLNVNENVSYADGGDSNLKAALTMAFDEFTTNGAQGQENRIIVLVVNDISTFRFNETLSAMNTLKSLVKLPIGITVPGLPGTPPKAHDRMVQLLGNSSLAFTALDDAVTGIPSLSDATFSCPECSGLIFIGEATSAIGWDEKLSFLKLVQRLALATDRTKKQLYGVALYGTQIYQSIQLQRFIDFNETINNMIDNMTNNNVPNGGQTYLAPVLNQLHDVLVSNLSSNSFAVLIMGQLEAVRDPSQANTAALNVASLHSDIYVLDQSRRITPTLWSTLTHAKPGHIINGTAITNEDDQFAALQSSLLQDFSNMRC